MLFPLQALSDMATKFIRETFDLFLLQLLFAARYQRHLSNFPSSLEVIEGAIFSSFCPFCVVMTQW